MIVASEGSVQLLCATARLNSVFSAANRASRGLVSRDDP